MIDFSSCFFLLTLVHIPWSALMFIGVASHLHYGNLDVENSYKEPSFHGGGVAARNLSNQPINQRHNWGDQLSQMRRQLLGPDAGFITAVYKFKACGYTTDSNEFQTIQSMGSSWIYSNGWISDLISVSVTTPETDPAGTHRVFVCITTPVRWIDKGLGNHWAERQNYYYWELFMLRSSTNLLNLYSLKTVFVNFHDGLRKM